MPLTKKKPHNFQSCSWAVLLKEIVLSSADLYSYCKSALGGLSSLGPQAPYHIMVVWASWLITTNPRGVICWNYQQEGTVISPVTSSAYIYLLSTQFQLVVTETCFHVSPKGISRGIKALYTLAIRSSHSYKRRSNAGISLYRCSCVHMGVFL